MLYNQMYRRWNVYCAQHPTVLVRINEPGVMGSGARPMPALPQPLVTAFVAANIEWAKVKVQARISRIFWGREADTDASSSTEANADDEYDATAEF